ncbi:hypothetical protein [Streptomyces arboris]|uniref:hypothetical protein n=1 Tax=Streptomyces arboris TaxID=2600619 RepID=UPI003BF5152C
MTPEQASARAALLLVRRLISRHGLTYEDAVTAVTQRRRGEDGPHTHLVLAEATAVLREAIEPIRTFAAALRPAAEAAARAMTTLTAALRTAPATTQAHPDRPAWATPYGPRPATADRPGKTQPVFADEIVSHPPSYSRCLAVRITPYDEGGEPDHDQALTYRFDEDPVMLGYVYRTYEPAIHESTGPLPYAPAATGLVAFSAPHSHPDPPALSRLAQGLRRRGIWLAVDTWSTTPGGETLYTLVPQWKHVDLDQPEVPAPPGHHVFALGEAIATRTAQQWPQPGGRIYHVEWATSLFQSIDTNAPPRVGFPAPTVPPAPLYGPRPRLN